MATGFLTMGTEYVVSVRVFVVSVPLSRGMDAVVGASVGVAVDSFPLSTGVRCYRDSGEESCLVIVDVRLE